MVDQETIIQDAIALLQRSQHEDVSLSDIRNQIKSLRTLLLSEDPDIDREDYLFETPCEHCGSYSYESEEDFDSHLVQNIDREMIPYIWEVAGSVQHREDGADQAVSMLTLVEIKEDATCIHGFPLKGAVAQRLVALYWHGYDRRDGITLYDKACKLRDWTTAVKRIQKDLYLPCKEARTMAGPRPV